MKRIVLTTLVVLGACAGEEEVVDKDGDGSPKNVDCNDEAQSIHPGADELPYDNIDQDCDGADLVDVDGDGAAGGPGGSDCNDDDEAISPDAPEVWYDGINQNCDDASDYDQDGDGFDSDEHGGEDCDDVDAGVTPGDADNDGFSGCAGDCDDSEKTVKPNGKRICGDALDNDCDGLQDCAVHGAETALSAQAIFNGQAGLDRAGTMVAPAGDVNGDGVADFLVGAPGRNSDQFPEERGVVHVVTGPKSGTLELANQFGTIRGEDVYIGTSASGVGDLDGDGKGDVLLGVSGGDDEADFVNGAVLLHGLTDVVRTPEGVYLFAENDDDEAGKSVGSAGDQDADAIGDLAVGAPRFTTTVPAGGIVYLISGAVTESAPLKNAMGKLTGTLEGERAGFALARDDFNGDAVEDLLVGAPSVGTTLPGTVYLAHGPVLGDRTLDTADAMLRGEPSDATGVAIGVGDVDADGVPDVLVGSARSDVGAVDTGMAYLVLGAAASGEVSLTANAAASFPGLVADDLTGAAVDLGDFDGDGAADVVIASPGAMEGIGAIHLFYGLPSGTMDLNLADGIISGDVDDELGTSMALVGDTSRDGFADLVLGAPGHKQNFTAYGRAYLFLGGTM